MKLKSMRGRTLSLLAFWLVTLGLSFGKTFGQTNDNSWRPDIPRIWDDASMKELELPRANPDYSPVHVTAEYYYQISAREIPKTYPVYHPDREPPGYMERLRELEPEVAFRLRDLRTKEDWIRAGEAVFNDPISVGIAGDREYLRSLYVRDREWHDAVKAPITRDGILPFYRYWVESKGKVLVGVLSCASCHTRVLSDGSTIIGGQGNFPLDRAFAYDYDHTGTVEALRGLERLLYAAPWTGKDEAIDSSREAIIGRHRAIPAGVMARRGADPRFPVVVPDLFGLQSREYLDRTGSQLHRDISDLMRYAALNQYGEVVSSYGSFIPRGRVPPPTRFRFRYSDEQ